MAFNKIKSFVKKIFFYFFKGVFVLAPFYLTFLISTAALQKIDSIVKSSIPGLGIMLLFFGASFIGYLGAHFVMDRVVNAVEKFLSKLPLINIIYSSFKDVTKALTGEKRKFDSPVLISMSKVDNLYRIGFVTKSDLTQINLPGKSSVYVLKPYSFSGDLFIVDRESLIPINAPAADISKLIISGGFIN